jgi:hypothetical protein
VVMILHWARPYFWLNAEVSIVAKRNTLNSNMLNTFHSFADVAAEFKPTVHLTSAKKLAGRHEDIMCCLATSPFCLTVRRTVSAQSMDW